MAHEVILRPMTPADIDAAHAVQALCYPARLRDSAKALASRTRLSGHASIALLIDGVLRGYILAHRWPPLSPPPVDSLLAEPPPKSPVVHYVHDLSIDPAVRGGGLGARLVEASHAIARAQGLARSELIAVEGAAPFWARMGYEAVAADTALAAKVRGYGPAALYMARALDAGAAAR